MRKVETKMKQQVRDRFRKAPTAPTLDSHLSRVCMYERESNGSMDDWSPSKDFNEHSKANHNQLQTQMNASSQATQHAQNHRPDFYELNKGLQYITSKISGEYGCNISEYLKIYEAGRKCDMKRVRIDISLIL